MRKSNISFIVMTLITIILFVGYIRGIVKFVQCDFKAPYKAEVIYRVGAITGLNAIFGWINIEDSQEPEYLDSININTTKCQA